MPILATTKIVAALVMPMTVPRSRITTPAPMKPMPGMICAANARVVAPDVTRHFVRDNREKGGSERDQQVGANPGWLVAQLTLEADDSAEDRGDEKPCGSKVFIMAAHPPSAERSVQSRV